MTIKAGKLFLVLGSVFALAEISFGQGILSSMVGRVTDASGAVVPAVAVVITNQGTGIPVQAATDMAGTYTVPNLYAGVYEIHVEKKGFEAVRITGIRVLAGQTVRQDIVLKVGSTTQAVTVTGAAPLVHTDSTNIAGEITSRQIDNLPMALQSIDTLLLLVPGAQKIDTGGNPMYGGGPAWGNTNFAVNGLAANDVTNGRGLIGYGTGVTGEPPVESLQEFKVTDGNMNAEYRMETSVDMVTKEGTNKFHGESYEYNQNADLAANTFVLNAAGQPRAAFNRNQFGGNIGGPIWKNKAFFFFNFGGFRQRQYSIVQLNFPTQAMREGDFGALGTQLYNPLTGAAFPGNQIPSSSITSQAQALVTYLPQLTSTSAGGVPAGLPNGAPDYVGVVSAARDYDAYDARLDYQLSAKDSLAGFFTHNVGVPWFQPQGTPQNYGNGAAFGYKTSLYHIAESHTFSPNTINDFRVGWLNFPQIRSGQNLNFDPRSLFPQQPISTQRGLPTMTYTGYEQIDDYGQGGGWRQQPSLEIIDNFTHVHGRHTLKAGADLSFYQWFYPYSASPLPSFNFTGVWTGNKGNPGQPQSVGNAFADFLLGDAVSSNTAPPGHDTKSYVNDWEFYIQDTWQAIRRLTFYYGIRYMDETPWRLRDHLESGYDISTNQIILPENSPTPTLPPFGANAAEFAAFQSYITTTKALGLPIGITKNDANNWGPRIGFAFRPFGNSTTVVRGAYGVSYAFMPNYLTLEQAIIPPWSGQGGNLVNPVSSQSGLPGKPTSQYLPDITFSNPFPGGGASPPAHPTLYPGQLNFVLPVLESWNLTLEHQIGASDMARVSYVGSQGHHLMWFTGDVNIPIVQTPNAPIQNQRPIQPWGQILATDSGGKQNFDQLQLEYLRRFAKGLTAQAEYQWTRALTNAPGSTIAPMIPQQPKRDYGENIFMPRHRLVFNYIYELPVGRGRYWLSNSPGVVDGLLGGWQVSGITYYQTGTPFAVGFQVPSNYIGWWTQGNRADRVPGNLYNKQSGHNITSGVQWFDPSAFAPPEPWAWGDSQPYSAWGPGSWNWDMSIGKSFRVPIRGLETPRLQLRADFFDAFNHFNLSNPSSTIADTRDGGPAIPAAGKIFSGSGNRTIQLGLKFAF